VRRADRLFQVIQLLRRRPVVTASELARNLEVSERTIYRDIRDLVLSGVPIEGEAGVGYTLRRGYDLPPLMFTEDEIEAMVLGARVVSSWGDAPLARAAEDALARIEVALPPRLKERFDRTPLFAPGFHVSPRLVSRLSEFRTAIDGRRKTWMAYTDPAANHTERTVWPLGLFFWGRTWTVTAWCELRRDFRDFRLDRIDDLVLLEERFHPAPGRTLDDYFRRMEEHGDTGDSSWS
jgi:predicted DNA-binding transcriptional regulator YafY